MGFIRWLADNWFTFLQSAGIIGGLLFTGFSFRADMRTRRATNLIAITQHHREIWTQLYSKPELSRVLSADVDLHKKPVTLEEELFVSLLILHLNSAFYAARSGMFVNPERLEEDIREFFSLPIPGSVWKRVSTVQNAEFVQFISAILRR